jgi:hypothetical protein
MAKLNAHREEILSLLEAGSSQAEVIRHFEQRGITISRSTLSDFVRQRQEREAATAAVEDEGLSERMVATLSFQRAIADELTDQLVDVGEALQQLKRDGDSHHAALLAAIGHTQGSPAASAEDIRPLLEGAIARLDRLAARTGGAGLRWIWGKALLVTGLLWGGLIAAWLYGTGFLTVAWATLLQ